MILVEHALAFGAVEEAVILQRLEDRGRAGVAAFSDRRDACLDLAVVVGGEMGERILEARRSQRTGRERQRDGEQNRRPATSMKAAVMESHCGNFPETAHAALWAHIIA